MKKLLFLFAALAFAACSSDEPEIKKPNGKLDPSAFIRIEAQKGIKSRSKESTDDYSALDIARFGLAME